MKKMKRSSRILSALAIVFSLCMVCFAACTSGGNNSEAKKYSVTINACEGVTVDCPTEVKENDNLSFTVTVADGYEGEPKVEAIIGGNAAEAKKGDNGSYTIENAVGDVVVTVSGVTKTASVFTVTVNACDGATVSGLDKTVAKNGVLTFSVGVKEGYEGTPVITATIGGKEAAISSGIGNFTSIDNIDGDVVITITGLTKKSLTVTKTAGDGVTISGENSVLYGEDYTFTVTLAEGYSDLTVTATVDGKVVDCTGSNGVYTVKAVKGSLTVDAKASGKKRYKIDFTTESEKIVLPETAEVESGEDYTFEISAKEGYVLDGEVTVKVNEVEIAKNADGKWTISDITEYCYVEVIGEAKEITYAITYTADVEEGLGVQTLTHYAYSAANVKFAVTLSSDYNKSAITVTYAYGDKAPETLTADEEGYYSFANVKSNVTVNVTGLTLNNYDIKFLLGDEVKYTAKVKVHEKLTAEQLGTAETEVVKDTEYKFVKWNENTDVEITSDCSFVAVTLWGEATGSKFIRDEKVVDGKLAMEEVTEEAIPDGFENVYKYVWADGENFGANSVSDLNIAKYKKLEVMIKGNHFVVFGADWDYSGIFDTWVKFSVEKTATAEYKLTVINNGEKAYEATVKGETVANIFYNVMGSRVENSEEAYMLYTTEIRGVLDENYAPAAAKGDLMGCPLREDKNLGVTSEVVAPMGYDTVYAAKDPDMAAINIGKSSEVRVGIMLNGYYLFKADWTKLVDKRGVWLEIKMTKENGVWTVTVSNLYQGDVYYSTTTSNNFLNEIITWGYSKPSDESVQKIYVTELRGTPDNSYGSIDKSIFAGGVKNETEEIPDGYDSLYEYDHAGATEDHNYVAVPLADMSLAEYDTVSFVVWSDQELFFGGGWNAYVNRGQKAEITLTKTENGWKISCSAKFEGSDAVTWLEAEHEGNTLAEIFAGWALNEKYSREGQKHFYATNLITHKIAE